MKKSSFLALFLLFLAIVASGNPTFAAGQDYDAATDVISESFARRIADIRCQQYFGKKELFDVVRYFDEKDNVAVYVFIYKRLGLKINKNVILEEISSYSRDSEEARKAVRAGMAKRDNRTIAEGLSRIKTSLPHIQQRDNFVSIYVSASKTHMPVIEWRQGLPEAYTNVHGLRSHNLIGPGDDPTSLLKFHYLGPLEVFVCRGDFAANPEIYSLSGEIKKIEKQQFQGVSFRRKRVLNSNVAGAKVVGTTANMMLDVQENKIRNAWAAFESAATSVSSPENAPPINPSILNNVPDFNQHEYLNILPGNSCAVMAVADVLGDWDHRGFWNLADFLYRDSTSNHPNGGFIDWGWYLNAIYSYLEAIANAIDYDSSGVNGTPAAGLANRILEFTNDSTYSNNLLFSATEYIPGNTCSYTTIVNEIAVAQRPFIIGTNGYPNPMDQNNPGPYNLRGGHAVAVVGVDPAGADPTSWSEPIAVYVNGVQNAYGVFWWDYADLWNRYVYLVSPGGSPGPYVTAPTLTAPENGDHFTITRPTLTWAAATGATGFMVQVATSPDFSTNNSAYLASGLSFTFPIDLSNNTYFWRVVAYNANDNVCEYGTGRSFTIDTSIIPSIITDSDTISVPENSTRTFQVRLSSQPPSTVAVSVVKASGDSNIAVSAGSSLSFTTSNWATWKTVTLSAADDADAANGQAIISLTASGLSTKNVTAVEEDDDAIAFNTGWDTWSVDEGSNQVCGVRLTAQPTSTVIAHVVKQDGDSSITITSGSTLTFTTSDWNSWHDITFSAAQDADAYNGTANYRIYATGIPDKYMPVVEQDDETMAFEIEGGITAISVPEGSTNTFRARLTAQPISDYVVTVYRRYDTDDTDIVVQSGYSMVFTSANYQTFQTVTLAALDDIDCADGAAEIRLKGVGINKIYKSVDATEADDDTMEILLSTDYVGIPEGGTSSFSVRLSNQPASNLVVSAARLSGDPDITVQSGSTRTFTTTDWGTPQQVTLAAAEDADSADGVATIRVSGTGLVSKDVTATEADNDGVVLYPEMQLISPTVELPDGYGWHFGEQEVGSYYDTTFEIRNTGDADLILNNGSSPVITIVGANAAEFPVQQQPAAIIAPDASTYFVIRYSPTSVGDKEASIAIVNNDPDENPYDIALSGTAIILNIPPDTPIPETPGSGVIGESLMPYLGASYFNDQDGDEFANAQWQVDDSGDFSSPEWDSGESFAADAWTMVPAGSLSCETTYYWRVRYKDSRNAWSDWSSASAFTTIAGGGLGWSTLGSGLEGFSGAFLSMNGNVYIGGEFTHAGGVVANNIVRWDGVNWFPLGAGTNDEVISLASMGDMLYAVGVFDTAGDSTTVNHVAMWDGANWSPLGIGTDQPLSALCVFNGEIYVGGALTTAGGIPADHIAKWDGSGWSAVGPGLNGHVSSIVVIGSNLYAAGSFSFAGATSVNNVAKWDGANWSPLGSGTDGVVHCLATDGINLYAGGDFWNAGGVPVNKLAKWNGITWEALGSGIAEQYRYVLDLATDGQDLYVTGGFQKAGGIDVNHIAKWDGTVWSPLDAGLSGGYGGHELHVIGDYLYVGGEFGMAGTIIANNIALWDLGPHGRKIDFNRDGQEDILWRYYGSGGYNRAWFLGEAGQAGIPLSQVGLGSTETTPAKGNVRGVLSDPREIGIASARTGRSNGAGQDERHLMSDRDGRKGAVSDPRYAGGQMRPTASAITADPRQMGILGAPAELAALPTVMGGADVMAVNDLTWQIVGTGDFNKDTHVDILWRNSSSGVNVIWLMEGANWSESAEILPVSDLTWKIVGTGDFDRDGNTDILWRNDSTGTNIIWLMNGTEWASSVEILGVSDPAWQIVGTGDFDRDGNVDILWRNSSGGWNVVWHMNGTQWSSSAELIQVNDAAWQIVGTGDYDNDGNVDILWRNGTTGVNVIWYMNGATWSSSAELLRVQDLNWKIVSR